MAGANAVSPPPQQQSMPRVNPKAALKAMNFTNPSEVWELVAKHEKLKSLKSLGQETLTKGGEVAGKMSEKVNTATQWLMAMARTHPYAFVMSLLLSGIVSLFVGSFLLLAGVWVMILAGVLASFCMVGFAVFAVVLMTTWSILFTAVCAGAAVYMPYILYMGLEAGWFQKTVDYIKSTVTKIIGDAQKLSQTAIDIVVGETRKLMQ